MEKIIFPPTASQRSEQEAAADLGARTHFLQKPFGVVELTQKIRTLVDGAAAAHR
jgi:hypothetical protein